ncbi:hypothetical protein [Pseudoduganella sp. OTU4001]|uniref:hypothetical protein n=1 Tax=Pseudoduganella sp. OTU4001 TaxID=3043854 RepID=UPI00313CB9FF
MKIALNEEFLSIARDVVLARIPHRAELVNRMSAGELTAGECQEIISAVSAEFCERGLNVDSEPTAYGLRLERLIDLLNRPNLMR